MCICHSSTKTSNTKQLLPDTLKAYLTSKLLKSKFITFSLRYNRFVEPPLLSGKINADLADLEIVNNIAWMYTVWNMQSLHVIVYRMLPLIASEKKYVTLVKKQPSPTAYTTLYSAKLPFWKQGAELPVLDKLIQPRHLNTTRVSDWVERFLLCVEVA